MLSESDIAFIDRRYNIKAVDKARVNFKKRLALLFGSVLFTVLFLTVLCLALQQAAKRELIGNLARDLSAAAASGQSRFLLESADWAALRTEMKRDLKRRAVQSASLPRDPAVIEALVDHHMQPEKVNLLMQRHQASLAQWPLESFLRAAYFSGLNTVVLELAPPPVPDKPWLHNQKPLRAEFRLQGVSRHQTAGGERVVRKQWMLQRLEAPDYLVPVTANSF